jgi:hypothetical protein
MAVRLGSQTQLPSVTRDVHEKPQGAGSFADRERLAHELANAVPGMAMTTMAAAVPANTFTFRLNFIDSSSIFPRTIAPTWGVILPQASGVAQSRLPDQSESGLSRGNGLTFPTFGGTRVEELATTHARTLAALSVLRGARGTPTHATIGCPVARTTAPSHDGGSRQRCSAGSSRIPAGSSDRFRQ